MLPETLKPDARSRFEWTRANPFGALRFASRLPGLKVPLVVYTLYGLAQVAYPAVWAYYAAARFGWSPGVIGLSLAILGISFALMQGLLQSMRSLTMVAGPVAFTCVFFAFTAPGAAPYLPGAPFLVSAAIVVGCTVLLGVVRKTQGALPA